MKSFKVGVILPCQNEEENVKIIAKQLADILRKYGDYEILFIEDGSKDNTLANIKQLRKDNPKIKFISHSRNFGHQNSLRDGLDHIDGDCIICMDADLQHPVKVVPELIKLWEKGYEIVYTIREEAKLSFFKRLTSDAFYWIINLLADTKIEKGAADFRAMDRKVVEALRTYSEKAIFYRGIIPAMGFKKTSITFKQEERKHGKSSYTLKKMFNLAVDGITSFSVLPLRFATIAGTITASFSFLYGAFAVIAKLFFADETISGWTSLLVGIFFLGGIQLLMIGILGEYIGKIFMEAKDRPNYIISEQAL